MPLRCCWFSSDNLHDAVLRWPDNINGIGSTGVRISNVRTVGGSTGIELTNCNGSVVTNFVAINMRGPYPRGQCFQSSYSDKEKKRKEKKRKEKKRKKELFCFTSC